MWQVILTNKQDYHSLKPNIPQNSASNLVLSNTDSAKVREKKDFCISSILSRDEQVITSWHQIFQVWVIGEGLDAAEQLKAEKGTQFIPYSQFPPRMVRKDCCTYLTTPAMSVPKTMQNLHSCEVIRLE